MHSNTDPSTCTPVTTPPPQPGPRPYPEHSVVSIALMLLLSAGVYWAAGEALREDEVVVQRWDFTGADGESPWTFPVEEPEYSAEGISYLALVTGPGPALDFEFDTTAVSRVRADVVVTLATSGEEIDFALEWYWAGPDDVAAAAGAWPFSTERGAAFHVPDRHRPDWHVVELAAHPRWTGRVVKSFIGLKLPENASGSGPCRVSLRAIEFLE